MKIIDTESTRRALPFERLIPALREKFVAGCEVPLRHTHSLQAGADVEGARDGGHGNLPVGGR